MAAYVNGDEVEKASGIERAAVLLGRAILPAIAGLMTDITGRLLREAGLAAFSLGELRNRGDLAVILGEGPMTASPARLESEANRSGTGRT
jgi:formylmethanofuran dehydrogenase subunit B